MPYVFAGTENDEPIEIYYENHGSGDPVLLIHGVPVLVMHGTEDRILPFQSTAARLPALIADCTLVPVEGGPHNIGWTFPEEVNSALLKFIEEGR